MNLERKQREKRTVEMVDKTDITADSTSMCSLVGLYSLSND